MARHRRNYQYEDAFKVLRYQSDDTSENLLVWNSRDGVVPFSLRSPSTGSELFRADWSTEVRQPTRIPQPGEWIFIGRPSVAQLKVVDQDGTIPS